jgi:hypothetical protein
MAEIEPEAASSARLREGPRSATAALLVCIVGFGGLGALLHSAAGLAQRKGPLSLTEDLAPQQVGQWTYIGVGDQWLEEGYPIGHIVLRYERADGATMLVTAAVGQERYGAFSNIAPTFEQGGYEKVDALPEIAQEPASGRDVGYRVSVYQGPADAGSFAFVGLYWNGRRLTTSLSAVKVAVTLRRAMSIPQPTVAVYFQRPIGSLPAGATPAEFGARKAEAAADVAQFAQAFLPTLEELRGTYARSGG